MDDRNKLLEALRTISEACDDTDDCKVCPLANSDGDCLIQIKTPALWNVKIDEEVDVWRAFYD